MAAKQLPVTAITLVYRGHNLVKLRFRRDYFIEPKLIYDDIFPRSFQLPIENAGATPWMIDCLDDLCDNVHALL